MSTPWGTSPYATTTPVIDSTMRAPAPALAPTPVPIPGLMPLPFPQLMAPPVPVPYLGMPLGFPQAPVSYLGMPPVGFPQAPAPYLGMPPLGFPQAPTPYLGMPPLGFPQAPVSYLGMPPVGFPQAPAPYLGMPPVGFPQAPTPYLGMPPVAPLGFHPAQAQALGLDMQTSQWPIAGLGGHAVSPVVTMLLSQIGLREAISRIGDETLKRRVTENINEAIDRTIEGVSGMTLNPWFGPGAQSMVYPIAAQLAMIAERYPGGAVQDALLNIAGQILQKNLAPTGESAGRHK